MDNRSHEEADWDLDLLGPELKELQGPDFDLALTGFDDREIDDFLADPGLDERANITRPYRNIQSQGPVTCGSWGRTGYCARMPPTRAM
jgi:hypothetical protein